MFSGDIERDQCTKWVNALKDLVTSTLFGCIRMLIISDATRTCIISENRNIPHKIGYVVTCKVANKWLNVREWVEVVEWNKRWSPPFPCCPVSCQCLWKKTLIEKKNKQNKKHGIFRQLDFKFSKLCAYSFRKDSNYVRPRSFNTRSQLQ